MRGIKFDLIRTPCKIAKTLRCDRRILVGCVSSVATDNGQVGVRWRKDEFEYDGFLLTIGGERVLSFDVKMMRSSSPNKGSSSSLSASEDNKGSKLGEDRLIISSIRLSLKSWCKRCWSERKTTRSDNGHTQIRRIANHVKIKMEISTQSLVHKRCTNEEYDCTETIHWGL